MTGVPSWLKSRITLKTLNFWLVLVAGCGLLVGFEWKPMLAVLVLTFVVVLVFGKKINEFRWRRSVKDRR